MHRQICFLGRSAEPFMIKHSRELQPVATGSCSALTYKTTGELQKILTANIGLAWALVTPITEAQNRQANFDFATGKFLIAGQNSDGRVGIKMDKTAFEPRIGLAWKPFGGDSTAIRAGYSIFHDSSWNQGAQGLWQNPPFYAESDNFSFQDLVPAWKCRFLSPTRLRLGTKFPACFHRSSKPIPVHRNYPVTKH